MALDLIGTKNSLTSATSHCLLVKCERSLSAEVQRAEEPLDWRNPSCHMQGGACTMRRQLCEQHISGATRAPLRQ